MVFEISGASESVRGAMIFDQKEFYSQGGDYSYLLSTQGVRGVIVIDPTPDLLPAYAASLGKVGHDWVFTLETGAVEESREACVAMAARWRTRSFVPCDGATGPQAIPVGHGDIVNLGGLRVQILGRVGRLNDAVSYCLGDRVFVGDRRAHEEPEILALPPTTLVYRSRSSPGQNRENLATSRNFLAFDAEGWKRMPHEPRLVPAASLVAAC